jgi:hypothetical protein
MNFRTAAAQNCFVGTHLAAIMAAAAHLWNNMSSWRGHSKSVTSDVNYKGYVHHASEDDPQYEIKSEKTDHIAMHKGKALRRRD